jgi:hypothetical protein
MQHPKVKINWDALLNFFLPEYRDFVISGDFSETRSLGLLQAAGLELKENLATGAATWPYPSVYHPYDAAAFAAYPFNG